MTKKCSTLTPERDCVSVCICGLGREGSWIFASTAVVAARMVVYLTGYNDYLTTFHEPLLPLYSCHTSLKNV